MQGNYQELIQRTVTAEFTSDGVNRRCRGFRGADIVTDATLQSCDMVGGRLSGSVCVVDENNISPILVCEN